MDLDGLEVDRSCTTNSSSSTCENVTRRLEDSYDSAMCCYQSSHLRCGETVTRRGETARGCGEAKPTAMHKVARRGTRGRSSGMERVLSHLVAVAVLIAILDWHSVSAQGLFDLPTSKTRFDIPNSCVVALAHVDWEFGLSSALVVHGVLLRNLLFAGGL